MFEAALEEERELRGATESRIQALEGELKEARGELSRTEADLNTNSLRGGRLQEQPRVR